MDDLNRRFVVFLLLSCLSVYNCQKKTRRIVTPLKNTVVQKGETVTLSTVMQREDANDFVAFSMEAPVPGGAIKYIWQGNTQNQPDKPSEITVQHIEDKVNFLDTYNLTINMPSLESGVKVLTVKYTAYYLLLPGGIKTEAYVTVVDGFSCRVAGGDIMKQVNVQVQLDCMAKYNGYRPPALYWYDNGKKLNSQDMKHNATTGDVSIAYVTTTKPMDDGKQYECRLDYPTTSTDNMPPQFTQSCNTTIKVQYYPTEVTFHSKANDPNNPVLNLNIGDTINCTSDGNPTPTYTMNCNKGNTDFITGNLVKLGPEFDLGDQQIECTCKATSVIKGQTKDVSGKIVFRASKGGTGGEVGGAGSDGWKIAVGIIIPIIVIAIIVGVVLYCVKIRNKDAKTPPANGGPAASAPEKPAYDNRTFQGSQPNIDAKNAPAPNYANTPEKNGPQPNYGGMTQQGYPGKGSPGYADLGVKHISGSLPGSTSTINSIPDPSYAQINRDPRGVQGPPPHKGTDTSV